ncbi:30S ribosome-binding factor RbfA [Hippea maritima]|uniref:Ribosome-binding factor A n=1 Tax=Hippea maritima (strain ATCC 700847 / DSM 10411 / MH2) TaxID=760142 RepID=F2LVA6_HIPMA|nr:30S ribosome-binding factor RbfA [Hippea maritima]AEA33690.1 Ribosome-binding factor A [Hippea maritima DSM 10411]
MIGKNSSFKRKDRVASQIKKAVSEILEFESGNEKLRSITLTDVEMTKDLRIAKIFVSSSMTEMTQKDTLDVLESAKGFIKKNLATKVRLKYMPKLIFEYDASINYGFKIDSILREIEEEESGNKKEDRSDTEE